MCTDGFDNSTCLLLRVTGRWRSTSLRSLISDQWLCSGIHTCHVNVINLIYIGAYPYKYVGHETANWLGWTSTGFDSGLNTKVLVLSNTESESQSKKK